MKITQLDSDDDSFSGGVDDLSSDVMSEYLNSLTPDFFAPALPPSPERDVLSEYLATLPAQSTVVAPDAPSEYLTTPIPAPAPATVVQEPPQQAPAAVVHAPPQQAPAAVVQAPPQEAPPAMVQAPPQQAPAAVVQAPPQEAPPAMVEAPPQQAPASVVHAPPQQAPAVVVHAPPQQVPAVVVNAPPQQAPAVVVQAPPQHAPAVVVHAPPQHAPAVVVHAPPQQAPAVMVHAPPLQAQQAPPEQSPPQQAPPEQEVPPVQAPAQQVPVQEAPPQQAAAVGAETPMTQGVPAKKKRGRPRKYNPEGSVPNPAAPGPKPNSAAAPVTDSSPDPKRVRKEEPEEYEYKPVNDWVTSRKDVTTHMLIVDVGQDIMMSVMAFVQKGPRAVCVLSGTGSISSVTLRAFDNSSGTVTLEGPYQIISLSGSFSPAPTGGKTNRSGGLSVSFVQADGFVRGGGIVGMVTAASVVQIVLVTFVPADKYFQTPVKEEEKPSVTSTAPTTPAPAAPTADPNAAGPSSSTPTGSEIMKEKETDVLVVDD